MENSTISYTLDYEEDYIFANPRVQAVLIFLYSIVFFFCFFGNLTVVLVMALHWKMRGSTKFCLGNLAFANLCVGTFCVYQDLSMYLIDSWIFGEFLCKMYHFTNNLAHTASILILVVIAIERYFAILHPFKCRRVLTIRKLRLIILGVWILSALLCSPRLYYIVTVTNALPTSKGQPMRYEVICTLLSSIYDSSTADMIQFILLFLLPLIIISVLYAKVGIFLRQRETFVCSFVQASSAAVCEVDSGERTLQRVNTRTSTVENLSRKVSFKEGSRRDRIQVKTDCKHSRSVRGRGCATCGIIIAGTSRDSANSNGNGSKSSRSESFRRAAAGVRRQDSTSSGSSTSVTAQLRRTGSTAGTPVPNPHKGVVRMLIIILITFALCNFPFHLRKLYQNFSPPSESDSVWTELATPLSFLLMYANCAINPILYAFMSRSFRASFMDCIRCQMKKPSQSSGGPAM